MSDKANSNDHFGVPKQLIIDLIKAKSQACLMQDGCYVPTRYEVATQKPFWLTVILLGWWWESPPELVPTDEQVADVIAILRTRSDADHWTIQQLVAQAPSPGSRTEG